MSDIFDHEADAWDSLDRAFDEGFVWYRSSMGRIGANNFVRDPLFYHCKLRFKRIVAETEKAYLFKIKKRVGVWIPKSVCRRLKKKTVYVHKSVASNLKLIDLR